MNPHRTLSPRIALLSGLILAALGAAGGWFAARAGHTEMTPAPTASRPVLYWFDPMKPDQHFDKPGKSPFMDMDLVPRYADEATSGTVGIDGRVAQNLAIRLASVEETRLLQPLLANASLAFNDRDVAIVQARSGGFVERVYARAPGDVITAGAPLADILIPEWAGAQSEFLALLQSGDAALIAAGRNRLKLLGMPASLIAMIEKNGQPHPVQTITAPIGGVIQSLDVRAGMTLAMGMPLARINGIATLWLEAAVPEMQASQLQTGQSLEARLASGASVKGRVIAILPELNTETRTLRVRAEIPNPRGHLRPGMWAEVRFANAGSAPVLAVPSEAVIRTGMRNLVMLAEGEGRYRPQEVETGIEAAGKTEIRAGLSAGQQVVVSGQFLLDSEASLKGVVAIASAPAKAKEAKAVQTEATGKIEAIKGSEFTISHEAIAALQWPPMTMPFALANEHLAHGFKVGDRIRFAFREAEAGYVIEKIEKVTP